VAASAVLARRVDPEFPSLSLLLSLPEKEKKRKKAQGKSWSIHVLPEFVPLESPRVYYASDGD
jgi:hypothetical protein